MEADKERDELSNEKNFKKSDSSCSYRKEPVSVIITHNNHEDKKRNTGKRR